MKILITSDCYAFQTGGVASVVLSLEHGLRALGHEVKVLALSNSRRSFREGETYCPLFPLRFLSRTAEKSGAA